MPSKPPRQRPGGRPPRRPGGRTAPRRAAPLPEPDRHDLYQRAVQCVEAEIDFVDATFRRRRGRRAVLLREDFCGTANTSCEWVRRRRENRAVGVDLDAPTLAWGIRHNLARLDAEQRTRVTLLRQDVLEARRPPRAPGYDVVLAMNFSYWIFKERERMRRYFTAVRRSLAPDGLFFLDHYAGSEVHTVTTERRAIRTRPRFTYIWDQASLNPITNEMVCHIHFELADGRKLRRAFTYDWRLWSIPEVRDLLHEAGFPGVTVYTEGDDGKGGGNGIFRPSARADADLALISYIVAEPGRS